jgi:hypothetical protein
MSNTGNLNYSLNKNDFYKIILGCSLSFIPFYFFLITSSSIYLYYIRYSKYTFPNKKPPYQINKDIVCLYIDRTCH